MRTGRPQTIMVNKDYFEQIDTERKAYWLGFIYADGHVAQKAPWTVIIQIKDIEHLEQFAKDIEYTGEIKTVINNSFGTNSKHGRLVICRKKMCDDLNKLGRNDEMSIPNIPQHLISHFIRGYFDGDGGINLSTSSTKNKYGSRYTYQNIMAQFIGTEKYLNEITNYLKMFNINSVICDSKSEYMKYIRISGGRNLRAFHKLLYTDRTICLKRKEDRLLLAYNTRAYNEKSL